MLTYENVQYEYPCKDAEAPFSRRERKKVYYITEEVWWGYPGHT
jgi:hypothetical protein